MNPFYTLINRSDMAEETVLFRGYINKILKNEKAKRKKTLKKTQTEQIYKEYGTPTHCSICINGNNKKDKRKGQKKSILIKV